MSNPDPDPPELSDQIKSHNNKDTIVYVLKFQTSKTKRHVNEANHAKKSFSMSEQQRIFYIPPFAKLITSPALKFHIFPFEIKVLLYEPRHENPCFMHMQEQRRS